MKGLIFTQVNTEDSVEGYMDILDQNQELLYLVWFFAILSILLLTILIFLKWRFDSRLKKMQVLEEEASHLIHVDRHEEELEALKLKLRQERAESVRNEMHKRELAAYIRELKAIAGDIEVKSKTIQIQRILSEQKTDDIVQKVEGAAKALYPDLVRELQESYPDLNQLELQYCMMMALGYNLDEVMAILGRTEKAVKSLRYRIRKKIGLKEEQGLGLFIREMVKN